MATADSTFPISHRQHPTDQSEASFPHSPITVLTAAYIQIPPPPGPEYPPSTLEQFGMLLLALILIFALVLLVLPGKWSRKVMAIAFCIGKGR
jgi:hypothetical protein